MKFLFRYLMAAVCVLPLQLLAAPASDASIEELMRLTRSSELMDASAAQLEPVVQGVLADLVRGQDLDTKQQQALQALVTEYTRIMQEELAWERVKPEVLQLYREVFTQEEVDAQIAFYRSPAGQAVIDKMPLVLQKSMEMSQRQMSRMLPRLRDEMARTLAQTR